MTDALRPMAKQRLYEQVLDRLRQYVAEGGLRAGDRLPPERDLAQRLGVSRASVKQAIVVLEVQGLVEARHGGGTYLVRDSLDVEPVERMVERRRRLPDVLEARRPWRPSSPNWPPSAARTTTWPRCGPRSRTWPRRSRRAARAWRATAGSTRR